MKNTKLKSFIHTLIGTDAVDAVPARDVQFSIALEKSKALGAIIVSPSRCGDRMAGMRLQAVPGTLLGTVNMSNVSIGDAHICGRGLNAESLVLKMAKI